MAGFLQRFQAVSMVRATPIIVLAVSLTIPPPFSAMARAADHPTIAGSYVCRKGCRDTDAPPGIDIKGDRAACMSELGGIYDGTRLNDRSVACFNMTGTLSPDGRYVLWSNGNIWERRPARGDTSGSTRSDNQP